MTYSFNFMN